MTDITMTDAVTFPHLILPGEILSTILSRPVKIGPGLRHTTLPNDTTVIQATQAGLLQQPKPKEFFVEYNSRRYIPAQGEQVIGQIIARSSETYRVDINSAHSATLSVLAFESATKQNRPQLQITQLVYARVATANKDIEPEIECFDATTGKSAGFGELKGGLLVDGLSMGYCRRLLYQERGGVLEEIGKHVGFQCAVGLNGRIWVDAGDVEKTILVARAIKETEGVSDEEMRKTVRELLLKS